jgi:hypothetical protein
LTPNRGPILEPGLSVGRMNGANDENSRGVW